MILTFFIVLISNSFRYIKKNVIKIEHIVCSILITTKFQIYLAVPNPERWLHWHKHRTLILTPGRSIRGWGTWFMSSPGCFCNRKWKSAIDRILWFIVYKIYASIVFIPGKYLRSSSRETRWCLRTRWNDSKIEDYLNVIIFMWG